MRPIPSVQPPLRLESLAEFLRFLSTMPHPDKVASALTRGPLSLFGTRACRIMIAIDDTRLVLVSQHGHLDAESSRYREIPLDLDMPVTRAYKQGTTVRSDVARWLGPCPHSPWTSTCGAR